MEVRFENIKKTYDGKTVLELARALKLDRSYVARTLSLVNLAPDIIVAVMQGKTPPQMTLAKAVNGKVARWHSCHNVTAEEWENQTTYVALMEQNLQVLKEVLEP